MRNNTNKIFQNNVHLMHYIRRGIDKDKKNFQILKYLINNNISNNNIK